jgi:glucokinase
MADTTGQQSTALLADVGGTYTRVALTTDPGVAPPDRVRVQANAKYRDLADMLLTYIDALPDELRPQHAAVAIACPVLGDRVRMTNLDWSFSIEALQEQLGMTSLQVINDFTAVALSIVHLGAMDVVKIGGGEPVAEAAIGVLGPGTGLGVSGLLPYAGRWVPIAGEGGHVTLAAGNDEEDGILRWFRDRYGHVSAERVLSGDGLADLYTCMAKLKSDALITADRVTALATAGQDPVARRTLDLFFSFLGAAAGDLALTLGARGGVYLAGGIVPRVLDALRLSPFRERFIEKGRFRQYLQAIPTCVIVEPYPAFKGLAGLLRQPSQMQD